MEEIIVRANTRALTESKELNAAIKKIVNEMSKGRKASHEIARQLLKIRDEELFKASGAKNFCEFCDSYFGLSASQATRYANVAEKFLTTAVLDEKGKKIGYMNENYSISQLTEMLKASDEQLDLITCDMSVREIRAIIKGNNALEDKSVKAEEIESAKAEEAEKTSKSDKTDKSDKSDKASEEGFVTGHFDNENDLAGFVKWLTEKGLHIRDINISYTVEQAKTE